MTFQQLTYLLEVFRAGSISRAADNLYLSQSSMSTAISALENELGFLVFTRGRDGITVTDRGEQVIMEATKILESQRNMLQAGSSEQKHYRISAAGYEPFDRAFCQLIQEYGHRGVFSHQARGTKETAQRLANYTLDVSVRLSHSNNLSAVENVFRERELQVERLGCVPVLIHVGPGHRLYDAPQILPSDLKNDVLVDYPHAPMLENNILRGVFTFDRRRVILTASNIVRNQLLAQGAAYAVGAPIPAETAKHYRLRSVPVPGVDYTVLMISNPNRKLDGVILRYMELIREAMANQTEL